MNRKPLLLGLISLCIHAGALGQTFTIDWSTIDGGGNMSSAAGTFALTGTIGQPDAGAMIGGAFELTGGFWPVTQVCYCPGDLNHDGRKDGSDIQQFVNCLQFGESCSCADVDQANGVSLTDVSVFVTDLLNGMTCP